MGTIPLWEKKRHRKCLIRSRLAGYVQLLDFVGVAAEGGGIDGDLEEFTAGIQKADEVFFVGFRSPVGGLEGTGGVGFEKGAEDFRGLLFRDNAGR